jgi:hypothetical protein
MREGTGAAEKPGARRTPVYGEDGAWLGDLADLVGRGVTLLEDDPQVWRRAVDIATLTSGFALRTDDLWRIAVELLRQRGL